MMIEKPNLKYIKELADGDTSVEKDVIEIIKNEFKEEETQYLKHLVASSYKNAAASVHKLNHKVIIFGLENNYELAILHEQNLKNSNLSLISEYENILLKISIFINNL
ncbi:Hpt domain-containing protein [uncultured Polaribacter sp.]|uniref:Hpt domain-containing protein n=1 Tax=uncultured Polaribacter sp. TaxID=174711 RepID=UPI00262541D2|nr:Hpt domain-containing protein [uncultured Polaribacter sp.]